MRFTAEEVAALVERAVVCLKAVFKHEADLVAVAEVFHALDAEARAELTGVFHRELVDVVNAGGVGIGMDVGQAQVNQTVDLNFSCGSGAGGSKSPGEGKCDKSLFHFLSLCMTLDCRGTQPKRNRLVYAANDLSVDTVARSP